MDCGSGVAGAAGAAGSAVAGGSGFDPYNSAGGLDRKPAWDRVTKR